MQVIRPICTADLDSLVKVARASGHGFTSLPDDQLVLMQRIEDSVAAMALAADYHFGQQNQSYLFVLEDLASKQILGTSGITSAVGLNDAFYHYRISKVVHSSPTLGIYNPQEVLTLCNDYTGATEIGSLYLTDQARGSGLGIILSKFRFLFIAENRHRFNTRIFAEMRGVTDDNGHSPFWHWLEKHFFQLDFPTADYLTGIGKKSFIAELMPRFPIYICLLDKHARKAIGQVHPNTEPALAMLKREGFSYTGYVDIFDAGPTVEAELKQIACVKASQKLSVAICTRNNDESVPLKSALVCNTKVSEFRAAKIECWIDDIANRLMLTTKQAKALNVAQDDSVRILVIQS
ncbi:arginine N-succinyltransferase [Catenovulum agarivorans]|nr:arginine N-succinyltransferase [Catenovulum agarivorans]